MAPAAYILCHAPALAGFRPMARRRSRRGTARVPALLAAAFAALLPPAPVMAQSFDEAVRSNLTLAVELCVHDILGTQPGLTGFRAAGFAYRMDGQPGQDVYHRFHAPADTVSSEIYEGQMAPHCAVRTAHLGLGEAIALVNTLLHERFPGKFRFAGDAQNPCRGFVETAGRALPVEVLFGSANDSAGCVEDGTTRITIAQFV